MARQIMSTHTVQYHSALEKKHKRIKPGHWLPSLQLECFQRLCLHLHSNTRALTSTRGSGEHCPGPRLRPATLAPSQLLQSRGLCTRCCRSCLCLSWILAHHHLLRRAGPRPSVLSSDYPPLQAPERTSVLAPSCRQGGPETAPGSAPAPGLLPEALLAREPVTGLDVITPSFWGPCSPGKGPEFWQIPSLPHIFRESQELADPPGKSRYAVTSP